LTGFDVEIERAIAQLIGVDLVLPEVAWEEHPAAPAAGNADLAAGATFSGERNRYTYFSKPYRRETDVLVLPKGRSSRYSFETIDQMLDLFAKQHFRLGVIAGYTYADERVNDYIADPRHQDLLVKVANDVQNLQNLVDDRRWVYCRSYRRGYSRLATAKEPSC
jgi:polar amino acid transport system substrate-binding protein